MQTIELHTKRLTIRTFLPGDEVQAHEYAGDTSITMMYWLPNKTFEETAAYIKDIIQKREQGLTNNLDFAILYENKIIGSIDLHIEEDKTIAYMGWVLKKDFRGLGFATEAAMAVRDYAFNNCGITKLLADCDARNTASANVMKKIGMQLVDDKGSRTYPKTGEVAVEHIYELNKLKEPSYKIVDYFELPVEQQQSIQNQIEKRQDLWCALPVILNFLRKEGTKRVSATDGGFHDILGPGRFLLMLDENNERLASFVSVARNDEVDITVPGRETWTPWVGCVFTFPEYRGNRLSEKLIYIAEEYAIKEFNAEYTYISTDHIGLYEKFGYEFFTESDTIWGETTRVMRKKVR